MRSLQPWGEGRPSELFSPGTTDTAVPMGTVRGMEGTGRGLQVGLAPPRASMYLVLLQQLAVPAQEHWNKVVLDIVGLCRPGGESPSSPAGHWGDPKSVDHSLIAWRLLTSCIGFRHGRHDG